MANSKVRGESPLAIEQKMLLALVMHLLMRSFLYQKGQGLELEEDHQTQQNSAHPKAKNSSKMSVILIESHPTVVLFRFFTKP